MLKAEIDANTFSEMIDVISALVNECRIHISEDGISTRAVDAANVAMVSVSLESGAFNTFSADPSELGFDVKKMRNIAGMMNRTDNVNLSLPEKSQKLELSFAEYRYSVTLLDPNTIRKDPSPPQLDLPAKVVISGDALHSAIKAAAVISDKIAFVIDPDTESFIMEAEGDTDHITKEMKKGDLISITPVKSRSLFSIDYLKEIGKVMSGSSSVEIFLGIDHPVRFVFTFADSKGHAEYLLAPRIEAD